MGISCLNAAVQYFPPVTEQGMSNLNDRMERMSALLPSWVAVTWGAGGTTQERSLFLAEAASAQLGLNPCLHLTCTNMEKAKLDQTLTVRQSWSLMPIRLAEFMLESKRIGHQEHSSA